MADKPITPFDELTTPSSLQILKLFLPYIPPGEQKMLAVYEKFLELQSVLTFYQTNAPAMHMQSQPEPLSFSVVLEKITPYLDSDQSQMIASINNAMSMMEMYREFQSMDENMDGTMDENANYNRDNNWNENMNRDRKGDDFDERMDEPSEVQGNESAETTADSECS